SGGGIHASSGTDFVTINNSLVGGNVAYESGGGVRRSVPLGIMDTTVDNNQGSYGGGISVSSSEATILNSAVTNNRGTTATSGGGGIYSSGEITIANTTISGNSTDRGSGGGLTQLGTSTAYLYNVTIANNTV